MDQGVKKLDDTHYEIDRALLTKILSDPSVIARAARIVPSIKEGKANGFKMYAIRPNSPYSRIGFQNGDTIHSINGFEMTSPDKALAMLVTGGASFGRVGRITVPGAFGWNVFRIRTGIPLSSAGWIVEGWITFAP